MSTVVRFVVAATTDLEDAADWYEARQSGLGTRFFSAVEVSIASIVRWPNSGRPVQGASVAGVRQVPVAGFPYQVVYGLEPETITILAIAHERRPPGYWAARSNG